MKVCNLTFDEYVKKIKSFHGSAAPGMIAGAVMIDLAMKNLPEGEFFDVICETQHCLVDAVQLLTPCTIGNGWLKIFDTSRYSIIFYNKYNGDGIRIFIDTEKINKWKEIKSWFMHDKPKEEQNTDLLLKQLFEHGSEIMGMEKVFIKKEFMINTQKHKDKHVMCPLCKEMYFKKRGDLCPICQGLGPYEKMDNFKNNYKSESTALPLGVIAR